LASQRGGTGADAKSADVESTVEYVGGIALLETLANGLSSGAQLAQQTQDSFDNISDDLSEMADPLEDVKGQVKGLNGTSHDVNLTEMNDLSKQDLLHPEAADRDDGNVCADDEEPHATLCYKTCSSLTGGRYPIRTTAFSCCMEEPCSFFNSKFTNLLEPCTGFDRAGSVEGKGCPHAPGTCMPNEEFSLGVCYMKCAVLTNNTFPYRSAASTCCRYNNHLACLDALNTITNPAFNIGGGMSDGHASTPNASHIPLQALTEKVQ